MYVYKAGEDGMYLKAMNILLHPCTVNKIDLALVYTQEELFIQWGLDFLVNVPWTACRLAYVKLNLHYFPGTSWEAEESLRYT